MKYIPVCALALIGLGASAITAQVIYNNASTAAEGQARGVSGIIQAQGERNLSNSQAAINLTDARSNQIDNQVKSVNAFWEKKGIYQEHVEQELAELDKRRNFYLSNHGLTSLTPEEFDRTTGTIFWPKVLEQTQFNPYRLTLDKLFKQRAYAGALTGDEYMEATSASKQWRAMLSAQKNVYPSGILSQMIRFILKLDRELDDNLG
ncbi:MAG: hypothetical protein WD468_06575 [Pirellulales bacterium]